SITALSKTMTAMIPASTLSPTNADTAAAINRINTSGLVNACKTSERKEWCCVAAGSFGPNWSSRASASCADKPAIAAGVSSMLGDMVRFPIRQCAETFEESCRNYPKYEATNVSHISDAACVQTIASMVSSPPIFGTHLNFSEALPDE